MSNRKKPQLVKDLGMLYPNPASKKKSHYGMFKCECGNIFKSHFATINSNRCTSCGCYKISRIKESNSTHGLSSHRLYDVWNKMISRTNNNKSSDYLHYGARNIKVCDRWLRLENFEDKPEKVEMAMVL